jgi:hypothetical protein
VECQYWSRTEPNTKFVLTIHLVHVNKNPVSIPTMATTAIDGVSPAGQSADSFSATPRSLRMINDFETLKIEELKGGSTTPILETLQPSAMEFVEETTYCSPPANNGADRSLEDAPEIPSLVENTESSHPPRELLQPMCTFGNSDDGACQVEPVSSVEISSLGSDNEGHDEEVAMLTKNSSNSPCSPLLPDQLEEDDTFKGVPLCEFLPMRRSYNDPASFRP